VVRRADVPRGQQNRHGRSPGSRGRNAPCGAPPAEVRTCGSIGQPTDSCLRSNGTATDEEAMARLLRMQSVTGGPQMTRQHVRHWVGCVPPNASFSSAGPLGSTASAGRAAAAPLFGGLFSAMGLCDCPQPYIAGVLPGDCRRGSRGQPVDSPDSSAGCIRACTGSLTPPGRSASGQSDAQRVALLTLRGSRHPGR